MSWEGHFWSVVDWAEEKGYFVETEGDDNCMDSVSKIIELHKDIADYEVKTYIALHEAGHVLIYQSPGRLNLLPPEKREDSNLSKKQKVRVILEEAEAWKRGYNLGMRLGIPINKDRWEYEQADALSKYMEWAIKER